MQAAFHPEAERPRRGAELRDMAVWEFAHRYGAASGQHAVRVDAEVPPLAS